MKEIVKSATNQDVCVCFEMNECDTPILRGVKSYNRAMKWLNEDLDHRFMMFCVVDAEPKQVEPKEEKENAQ